MATKDNKNIQRDKFFLTINSPLTYGYTHQEIFKIAFWEFPSFRYAAVVDEKGSNFHSHVFLIFNSRVRWSTVQKHFPHAHIDIVKGTVEEVLEYMKKEGKWLNDEHKQEQKIEGSFEEQGELPEKRKEKNTLLSELYAMILEGKTNSEIINENTDYISYLDLMDRVRMTLQIDQNRTERRLDLRNIYVFGKTGTGKTRMVLDRHGDENVFRVTDYKHPFDNYHMESVMCLEEFRDSLPLSQCLQLMDIYMVELSARYSNKLGIYKTLYMVSNWPLQKQFAEIRREDPESYNAFKRRIHYVLEYVGGESVCAWTGKDYFLGLNRKNCGAILFTTQNIADGDWMKFVDLLSTETAYKILKGEADIEDVYAEASVLADKMGNPNLIADIVCRKDILEHCVAEKRDIGTYISELFHSLVQDNKKNFIN